MLELKGQWSVPQRQKAAGCKGHSSGAVMLSILISPWHTQGVLSPALQMTPHSGDRDRDNVPWKAGNIVPDIQGHIKNLKEWANLSHTKLKDPVQKHSLGNVWFRNQLCRKGIGFQVYMSSTAWSATARMSAGKGRAFSTWVATPGALCPVFGTQGWERITSPWEFRKGALIQLGTGPKDAERKTLKGRLGWDLVAVFHYPKAGHGEDGFKLFPEQKDEMQ